MKNSGSSIGPQIIRAAQRLWDFHCVYDPLKTADAIVGLGSYDTRVAERCAALFFSGFAPKIVFTGAEGNWTRGLYDCSEASAFAAVAKKAGVPEQAIILEERATNISENIRFVSEYLRSDATIIFVTKPQTQRRCRATAAKQWATATTLVTAPEHKLRDQPTEQVPMREFICEMVGDLKRLEIYPGLGFQAYEEIPSGVLASYRKLVGAGFTDHLPR